MRASFMTAKSRLNCWNSDRKSSPLPRTLQILEHDIGDPRIGERRVVVERRNPEIAITFSTAGFLPAMALTRSSTAWVRSSEAPSGNCAVTRMYPWSSIGRKPVGTRERP